MEIVYNRHYIETDEQGRIIKAWSDGPHPGKDTSRAVCIREQGGYQFRLWEDGEENPPLFNDDGTLLYRWDGVQVLRCGQEENEEAVS